MASLVYLLRCIFKPSLSLKEAAELARKWSDLGLDVSMTIEIALVPKFLLVLMPHPLEPLEPVAPKAPQQPADPSQDLCPTDA